MSTIVYGFLSTGRQEVQRMGNQLGDQLKEVRSLRGLSLAAVAEPSEISTTYLQKLEAGDVASPSPNVLHRLAATLEVSYAALMEAAGYVVPGRDDPGVQRATSFDHALSSADLTADERRAVAAFVAHLRDRREDDV